MAVIYVKIELWSLLNAELAAVIPSDGHSMTLTMRKRRLVKRSRFLCEGILCTVSWSRGTCIGLTRAE